MESQCDEAYTQAGRWVPLTGMHGTYADTDRGETRTHRGRRGANLGSTATRGFGPNREIALPVLASGQMLAGRESRSVSGSARPLLEWVIVGGGIHGTYLSNFLVRSGELTPAQLAVVDPHEEPLARWKRNADNVGMEHLRSAAVHHLDLASLSLKRFAAGRSTRGEAVFLAPYGRPPLELFNAHADATIRGHGLARYRLEGRVTGLEALEEGFRLTYATGGGGTSELNTRRVILAIGMNDETCYPEWAARLRVNGMRVRHVLDPDFSRPRSRSWSRAIVYGGGLSGVQLSLALAAIAPGSVTLLSGHRMQVHLFDSEPSWQGANFMRRFASERDAGRRRSIIARERHRGSLTPEADLALRQAQARGALDVVEVAPDSIDARIVAEPESGRPVAELHTDQGQFRGDLLVLATGYARRRPGGAWLDKIVEELGLPCGPCGFPIPTPSLEWMPGLFVSGPLAELELGPVARNISGAHRTAARLEYFLSLPSPHFASQAG